MRYLILLFALPPLCFLGCAAEPNQTKLKPGTTFELHAVAAQGDGNTKPLADPESGAILNLVTPPIITAANVDTASVTTDVNGNVIFNVNVDNPGAIKLQAATAAPGNQLAVVVNGKIASAPVIRAQIGSQFQITGSASQADWEKIVQ